MVSPQFGLSRWVAGHDICSCGQGGGGAGEALRRKGSDKRVRNSWLCILHEGGGINDKPNDSQPL